MPFVIRWQFFLYFSPLLFVCVLCVLLFGFHFILDAFVLLVAYFLFRARVTMNQKLKRALQNEIVWCVCCVLFVCCCCCWFFSRSYSTLIIKIMFSSSIYACACLWFLNRVRLHKGIWIKNWSILMCILSHLHHWLFNVHMDCFSLSFCIFSTYFPLSVNAEWWHNPI